MTIPALSSGDKSFICSYSIGSNADFRLAMGVMNVVTAYTTEYVEGKCRIPVYAPQETTDHSHHIDALSKDVVYVEVGCRVSSDGYIHTWLTDSQKVSELILWNTRYDQTYYAVDDTTVLHWVIEKLYAQMLATGFVASNIKFQKYVSGTRLYMFGNYSNSLTNPLVFNSSATVVSDCDASWYPNNHDITIGDVLTTGTPSRSCSTDSSRGRETIQANRVYVYDNSVYTDYTERFNYGGDIPIPTDIGDYLYIGYSYMFFTVMIDTLVAGTGGTTDWEYWNGSIWDDIAVSNSFLNVGEDSSNFNSSAWDWSACNINGYNRYWIRARIDTPYTTAATIGKGYIRRAEYSDFTTMFMKEIAGVCSEPSFWYATYGNAGSVSIDSLCDPTTSASKDFTLCHIPNTTTIGTGNNSGRTYTVGESMSPVVCAGSLGNCGVGTATGNANVDMEPNRAYTWVPSYCSGAAGGNQTECEANGGTWVPGHYTCQSGFTYDTSVSFTYAKWNTITPNAIDHSSGRAYFGGTPLDYDGGSSVKFLAQYYSNDVIDTFAELLYGDLDELKHEDMIASTTVDTKLYTFYTKHVAAAMMTSSGITNIDSDWIVNWGANDYNSTWVAPDGLAARNPGSTQALLDRPITHHDEFYTGTTDIEGGFLYDLTAQPGIGERAVDKEGKIFHPVCDNTDFDWLEALQYSHAFLERGINPETKITHPVHYNTEFDALYDMVYSHAFLGRDPGTEAKPGHPVCNAEFCWLYELYNPFPVYRFLKIGGDDLLDGKTCATAWATWNHAMATIDDGTILYVGAGTYSEVDMSITKECVIYPMTALCEDEPCEIVLTPL